MASRTVVVGGAIAVDGLSESIRGLKKLRPDLPRVVSKASRELVKGTVLPEARNRWASQRIKPSAARKAVTATATQSQAALILRYSVVSYAAGVEYGSKRFPQFRAWRGNRFTVAPGSSTGYVAQDAIRDTLPKVEKDWADTVAKAIDAAVERG